MVYASLLILLFVLSGFDYGTRKTPFSYCDELTYLDNYESSKRSYVISVTSALLFLWFLYAIIIMGLRGDFSADYNSYVTWFHRMNSMSHAQFWESFGIHNIFSAFMETGFAVLNRIIGRFTNNHVWLFFVCAIIICFPVFVLYKKSDIPWLAVLLWISIGPYLEGFNTMRGAMASSILIVSLKYLQERKLIKYVIVVLLATTFHSIAILMLFVYFLPLIKPSKRNVFIIVIISILVSAGGEILALRFNSFFHISSSDSGALSLLYRYSSSGASLIAPLLIEILSLRLFFGEVKKGNIDLNDYQVRMMFNGNLIWIFFKILTIFTGYSTRFAMLFFYYPCIFIPFLLGRRERNKAPLTIIIVVLAASWYLMNILMRFPVYYFAI